jgi:hypothetical protein
MDQSSISGNGHIAESKWVNLAAAWRNDITHAELVNVTQSWWHDIAATISATQRVDASCSKSWRKHVASASGLS